MKARRSVLLVVSIVIMTLGVGPVLAQDWAGSGRVRGTVSDADGNPIAGAKVIYRLLDDESQNLAGRTEVVCREKIGGGASDSSRRRRIPQHPLDVTSGSCDRSGQTDGARANRAEEESSRLSGR